MGKGDMEDMEYVIDALNERFSGIVALKRGCRPSR